MATMIETNPADADRWMAVQRRDPGADGQFVYSVATTGVYCRPSCASRPARPDLRSYGPTSPPTTSRHRLRVESR